MQDLTFGEQVKIVLNRKNMTIKDLAKQIEGRTRKKMSRQNLTQRLGRDNFQEQDMRMIADILGCSFQLNILEDRALDEKAGNGIGEIKTVRTEDVKDLGGQDTAKNSGAKGPLEASDAAGTGSVEGEAAGTGRIDEASDGGKDMTGDVSIHERDMTIGEFLDINEELDAMLKEAEGKQAGFLVQEPDDGGHARPDQVSVRPAGPDAAVSGRPAEESGEDFHSEVTDVHREADAAGFPGGLAEPYGEGHIEKSVMNLGEEYPDESAAGYAENGVDISAADSGGAPDGSGLDFEEGYSEGYPDGSEMDYGDGYPAEEGKESVEELLEEIESLEKTERKEEKKEEKPHGWRAYFMQRLKRRGREQAEDITEEDHVREGYMEAESAAEEYEEAGYGEESGSQGDYAGETGGYEGEYPESDYGQEIYQEEFSVEEEDQGDKNPYTGREYESNSVRMHPSRIGYVQVYDRSIHKWTDMTEWAFLGYQERKKQLLGKDYDPPIYLD